MKECMYDYGWLHVCIGGIAGELWIVRAVLRRYCAALR